MPHRRRRLETKPGLERATSAFFGCSVGAAQACVCGAGRRGRTEPCSAHCRCPPVAKRKQKLKVFKTPIGFHDAFVAAPSRKAALEAWGAGTDLFSAGIAEEVSDGGKAADAALAKPGEVVRLAREGGKDKGGARIKSGVTKSRKARPSRAALDKAEAALAALDKKQSEERGELAREEEKLAKRKRAMEERQSRAREKAEAKLKAAETRYREALRDSAS